MDDVIGAAWLERRFNLQLVLPLPTRSSIGARRASRSLVDGRVHEVYVESMRPDPTVRGHLTFHLKHEAPSLELLVKLFAKTGPQPLADWIRHEPTGQYARRACFMFEWLTGQTLDVPDVPHGNYVEALDSSRVVTASSSKATVSRRFRVRDNMPGTPAFCPLVRRTDSAAAAMSLDVPGLLAELREEFGADMLVRSAVWMTLRESKSSFTLEGEGDQETRIQRFAGVIGRRTGKGRLPLAHEDLAALQAEILGERTSLKHLGLRRSPVFVGESIRHQEVVHYIAPPPEDLQDMLAGLVTFLERTEGQSPVMRAAVASFGFVYIHPLADGNGRVHRFLVNDILRRDGAIPEPLILPISSLITADRGERRAYDQALESVSQPLMQALAGQHSFDKPTLYPDEITSNLHLHDVSAAQPVWRTPDLTPHVCYLAQVLERTIQQDMREESRYLRCHTRARDLIKEVVEMPDCQVDRVIRSFETNRGQLSNVLAKEIPILGQEGVWEDIQAAMREAFDDPSPLEPAYRRP